MILSNKQTTKAVQLTAEMRRMVCIFVVCKPLKKGFLMSRPMLDRKSSISDPYVLCAQKNHLIEAVLLSTHFVEKLDLPKSLHFRINLR